MKNYIFMNIIKINKYLINDKNRYFSTYKNPIIKKIQKTVEKIAIEKLVENNDLWLGYDAIDDPTISILGPIFSNNLDLEYNNNNIDNNVNNNHINGSKWWENINAMDPFIYVKNDLDLINKNIRKIVGTDHPVLSSVAKYLFLNENGKKIRPTMILLISKAASYINIKDNINKYHMNDLHFKRTPEFMIASQHRLAEITEMIHAASLLHDDVIDESDIRRGRKTINQLFGDKIAILAGDFLLARSSICLARLRSLETIELMSVAIEHLVKGEIMQMKKTNDNITTFEHYLRKNYYKTGSLMANSCKAALVLGGHNKDICEVGFLFGRHVGLAFQLIDDILDFEGIDTGKPLLADLKSGLATAPVLIAQEEFPILEKLIQRKFKEKDDIHQVLEYIKKSSAIEKTRELAKKQIYFAMNAISNFPTSDARDSLAKLAHLIIYRNK